MKIFNEYETINILFVNCINEGTSECEEKREQLESFVENKLNPILAKVSELICCNKDKELLNYYMSVINKTENVSNEQQYNLIGEIFICQPDLLLENIKKESDVGFWIKSLEFGFYNVASEIINIKRFNELVAKLEDFKNEL